MGKISDYTSKVGAAVKTAATGFPETLKYFVDPKKIETEQYPENRDTLKMTAKFRGLVAMPHDTEGEHKCTGCTLCESACPNGTISVLNTKNIAGKKVLGKYIYRLEQCTFCAMCVEACPYGAIVMSHDFEESVFDRTKLELVLNKKEGRG